MRVSVEDYVTSIHAACDQHDRDGRAAAQQRLRERERAARQQSSRPRHRGMPRRSSLAAWDRLRAAGLLPAPRILPAARPLPGTTIPDWMVGLRDDEMGLAWLASVEFPTADPARWVSRAQSIARSERTGRYGGDDPRSQSIIRDGSTSYLAADGSAVGDWLARHRDDVDEDTMRQRMDILRRVCGGRLADCLSSGMTHDEAARVCGIDSRTIRRRLRAVREIAASL